MEDFWPLFCIRPGLPMHNVFSLLFIPWLLVSGPFGSSPIILLPVDEPAPVIEPASVPVAPVEPPAPDPVPAAPAAPVIDLTKCDEATQWVRADNGECLDKPVAAAAPATAAAPAANSAAAAPAVSARLAVSARSVVPGNGYDAGYCTWYVKNRRPDLPNNLGNAKEWYGSAQAHGIPTGSAPAPGAVGVSFKGEYGHVVYVESVSGGSVTISEMNYRGLYQMTTRTVPASSFVYIY